VTKHSKKDIVESLQSRFPKLAEHIERSAAAIEDAYKLVRRSTVESYKRDRAAITTLAKSGVLPGAVAKFFIGQLVDPPQANQREIYKRIEELAEQYASQYSCAVVNTTVKGIIKKEFRLSESETNKIVPDVLRSLFRIKTNADWMRMPCWPPPPAPSEAAEAPAAPSPVPPAAAEATPPRGPPDWTREFLEYEETRPPSPEQKARMIARKLVVEHPKLGHDKLWQLYRQEHTIAKYESEGTLTWDQLYTFLLDAIEEAKGPRALREVIGRAEEKARRMAPTKGVKYVRREGQVVAVPEPGPGAVIGPPTYEATKAALSFLNPFPAAVKDGRGKIAAEAKKFADEEKKNIEDAEKEIEKSNKRIIEIDVTITQIEAKVAATQVAATAAGGELGAAAAKALSARDIANIRMLEREKKELDKFVESEKKRIDKAKEDFPKTIKEHLKAKADEFAASLADKYKIPNRLGDLRTVLEGEASGEAARYANYLTTGKAGSRKFGVGAGFIGMNVGDYLRSLIFDYWGIWLGLVLPLSLGMIYGFLALLIWGAIRFPPLFSIFIVWTQFAFILGGAILGAAPLPGYTGMSTFAVIIYAVLGAAVTLAFNISKKKGAGIELYQNIASHVLGGAIIALSAVILVLSLQAFGAGELLFIVMTVVLIAIGVFQVYPTAGLHGLNVIAIIIMIFGYLALGPYSAMVIQTVDQVTAPFKAAQLAASNAASDIWLLITNPTQYYAQQQLKAARAERPTQFPLAVELSRLDVVPEGTVPGESEFAVFVLAENQGDLEAKDVKLTAECAASTPPTVGKCKNVPNKQYSTSPTKLRRGEAVREDFTFQAVGRTEPERQAETVFNKVNITLSYTLSTSSSLQVEIATDAEITKRQRDKIGKVFYPQVAVAKVGPAQIGINVGPQPIKAGKESAILLLSLSNTRPDGSIVLSGSKLTIKLSEVVGNNLKCTSSGAAVDAAMCTGSDKECTLTINYRIRPYEYRDVLPILCSFDASLENKVVDAKTGLVTAVLDKYSFTTSKDKSIAVGPKLRLTTGLPQP